MKVRCTKCKRYGVFSYAFSHGWWPTRGQMHAAATTR